MPRIAKTAPGTEIFTEGQSFVFDDGTRQVTQAEEDALKRLMAAQPDLKIEFSDKKGAKS